MIINWIRWKKKQNKQKQDLYLVLDHCASLYFVKNSILFLQVFIKPIDTCQDIIKFLFNRIKPT